MLLGIKLTLVSYIYDYVFHEIKLFMYVIIIEYNIYIYIYILKTF